MRTSTGMSDRMREWMSYLMDDCGWDHSMRAFSRALVDAPTRAIQRLMAPAWCLRPAITKLQHPMYTPAPSLKPQCTPSTPTPTPPCPAPPSAKLYPEPELALH